MSNRKALMLQKMAQTLAKREAEEENATGSMTLKREEEREEQNRRFEEFMQKCADDRTAQEVELYEQYQLEKKQIELDTDKYERGRREHMKDLEDFSSRRQLQRHNDIDKFYSLMSNERLKRQMEREHERANNIKDRQLASDERATEAFRNLEIYKDLLFARAKSRAMVVEGQMNLEDTRTRNKEKMIDKEIDVMHETARNLREAQRADNLDDLEQQLEALTTKSLEEKKKDDKKKDYF